MKKLISALMATALMLSLLVGVAYAADETEDQTEVPAVTTEGETETPENETEAPEEEGGEETAPPVLVPGTYGSITGKIVGVTADDVRYVMIEDEEGNVTEINVVAGAYLFDGVELVNDQYITAFYDLTKPMIMIYPPRYPAVVVAPVTEDTTVFVGLFDEELVSADNTLQLMNVEDAEITTTDGEAYEGELTGKTLAVVYGASTKSIPAQTNPTTIVVLPDEEEAPVEIDVSEMDIVVNETVLEGASAFTAPFGITMLPLRAIAEELGYEVTWNDETRTVWLDDTICLTIGEDAYCVDDEAVALGDVPVIVEGFTYVPLQFFTQVAGLNNAYIFEGQIVINNGEKME